MEFRFGLDRREPRTLDEVVTHFDMSRDEVRALEAEAAATLRRQRSTGIGETYPELRANERTTLEQFLDQWRCIVRAKLADLDEAQATARVLAATDLTVGGIVKHLAWAEDRWFQEKLLGMFLPEPWASAPLAEDPDWPFHSSQHDSVEELLALYDNACARSRAAASRFDSLDSTAAVRSFGKGSVSLRWIFVHMIDETARHAGHLDLLRDAIDK